MAPSERLLTHPSQLNSLSVMPFRRTRGTRTLRLGGSVLNHPDRARWEAELNRQYHACGCDTAAKGLIIGLAGGAGAAYAYLQGMWAGRLAVAAAVALVIGAAIAGKMIGLLRANRRLDRKVKEIQTQWVPTEQPGGGEWMCG